MGKFIANQDGTFTAEVGEEKLTLKTPDEVADAISKARAFDKQTGELGELRRFKAEHAELEASKAKLAEERKAIEAAKLTPKKDEPPAKNWWDELLPTGNDEAKVDVAELGKKVGEQIASGLKDVPEQARAAGEGGAMLILMEETIMDAIDFTGITSPKLRDDIRNDVINQLRATPGTRRKEIPNLVGSAVKERREEFAKAEAAESTRRAQAIAAEAVRFGNSGSDLSAGGTRIELGKGVAATSPEGIKVQLGLLAARRAAGHV